MFPPLSVVTEPQFEFPESYSKFPWLSILYVCVCVCARALSRSVMSDSCDPISSVQSLSRV